jgi:hypothetical protein
LISLAIAGIAFACSFGGAVFGIFLRMVLPEHHVSSDFKEVARLVTGLLATISALVLGLLLGYAKSSFDAQRAGFQQLATNALVLDRLLAHYGPEAAQARQQLGQTVTLILDSLWPPDDSAPARLDAPAITAGSNALFKAICDLAPKNDAQRSIQSQALQLGADMTHMRWKLAQAHEGSMPAPFMVVLMSWLAVLFTIFGLCSKRTSTMIVIHFVCALSVAGALFLIDDLDRPFDGLIQISDAPLRYAQAELGK